MIRRCHSSPGGPSPNGRRSASQREEHHAPAAGHAARELRRGGAGRQSNVRLRPRAASGRRQALRAGQGRPGAHGRAGLPGRARGRARPARDDPRERRGPRPDPARRPGAGPCQLGRGPALLNGAASGGLAVVLITARVETPEGIDLDAHTVPLALITLFEGWPTALVATTLPAAYRVWLGGNDAWASLLSLGAAAAAGSLAHVWARRDGGVRPRHALTLSLVGFVTTFASFALLGPPGLTLVERAWLPLLAISVVGPGVVARPFRAGRG